MSLACCRSLMSAAARDGKIYVVHVRATLTLGWLSCFVKADCWTKTGAHDAATLIFFLLYFPAQCQSRLFPVSTIQPCIHPSIHPSIDLSVSVHIPISISICSISLSLSDSLSVRLSVWLPICLSIYLSFYVYVPVCLSVYLSISLSLSPSLFLWISPSSA